MTPVLHGARVSVAVDVYAVVEGMPSISDPASHAHVVADSIRAFITKHKDENVGVLLRNKYDARALALLRTSIVPHIRIFVCRSDRPI